jgi:hypothetical protein
MLKKSTNLLLILAFGASVAVGMPLHSNEQESSMSGTAGVDCCKKAAQVESLTPEVSTARLCCALNCSQTGTTGSSGSQLPRPSTSQPIAFHPSSVQPSLGAPLLSFRLSWADSPPPYSNPAYIRHLALLI